MLTSMNYDTSVCWSLIVLASGDVDIPLLLIQSPIPRQVDIKVIVSPPFACHSARLYSIQLSFSVVWRTGLILTLAQKMFWQPASFSPQRERSVQIFSIYFFQIRVFKILTRYLQTLHKIIIYIDIVSTLTCRLI